jgi:hypothetical protein
MSTWLDHRFWPGYFANVFVPQVTALVDAIEQRVLPGFEHIDQEVDEAAHREYERLGQMPADDSYDMADAAEQAVEAGIDLYQTLRGVRQALLNVSAAALYHLFEQQLLVFYRRQGLHARRQNDDSNLNVEALRSELSTIGINFDGLSSWPTIVELRLLANAVKHAEGDSAAKLRKRRPQLYADPSIAKAGLNDLGIPQTIFMPLAGQDIYVTQDDLARYSSAIASFWKEFGEAVFAHGSGTGAA